MNINQAFALNYHLTKHCHFLQTGNSKFSQKKVVEPHGQTTSKKSMIQRGDLGYFLQSSFSSHFFFRFWQSELSHTPDNFSIF